MFSSFWYSPYGYNPYGPYRGTSNAYPFVITATGGDCYNPMLPFGASSQANSCPTNEEMLNYVTALETNRKLDDLSNVTLGRTAEAGDCLVFDPITGMWTLTNYISGGAF